MTNKLEEARKNINEIDSQMAVLFIKRMRAVEQIYEHKKEFGLPIIDRSREDAVIAKNAALIEDEVLQGYYIDYLKHLMSISRAYQYRMQNESKEVYRDAGDLVTYIDAGRIFQERKRVLCR